VIEEIEQQSFWNRANQEVKKELAAFIDVAPSWYLMAGLAHDLTPKIDAGLQRERGWRTRGVPASP